MELEKVVSALYFDRNVRQFYIKMKDLNACFSVANHFAGILQNQMSPPPQDFFYYKGGCKSWKAESLTQTRCPENWPSGAQSGAQCQQHEDIIWKNLAGTTIVEL